MSMTILISQFAIAILQSSIGGQLLGFVFFLANGVARVSFHKDEWSGVEWRVCVCNINGMQIYMYARSSGHC